MSALPRGANVALTKENPGLTTVDVAIDWGRVDPAFETTLAMAALLTDREGQALTADDLVYFNQLQAPDDAAGWAPIEGGERVRVQLDRVPERVEKVAFVLYADPLPASVPLNLSRLNQCTVRVFDAARNAQLVASENLAQSFSSETASIVAELYRHRGEWKFRVVAQGFSTGMRGVLESAGVPR